MIQAEYIKTGICMGCGTRGCLMIRAQAFIDGLRQASSIRLCINCVVEAMVAADRAQGAR
jgi:hypothetical protein